MHLENTESCYFVFCANRPLVHIRKRGALVPEHPSLQSGPRELCTEPRPADGRGGACGGSVCLDQTGLEASPAGPQLRGQVGLDAGSEGTPGQCQGGRAGSPAAPLVTLSGRSGGRRVLRSWASYVVVRHEAARFLRHSYLLPRERRLRLAGARRT